jgi:hypothetical protein
LFVILEYPDSQPAVEDLRICLQKTDLRFYLTQKLQRALETRLLHPGVNTPDVLTAYVAAIRALRQLDPTGVLLETVTQPVRYVSSLKLLRYCIISLCECISFNINPSMYLGCVLFTLRCCCYSCRWGETMSLNCGL